MQETEVHISQLQWPSQKQANTKCDQAGDYLIHVEKRLEEEQERLVYYLDSSTKKALVATIENQLIEAHVDSIIAKGLDKLLDQVYCCTTHFLKKDLTQFLNSFP